MQRGRRGPSQSLRPSARSPGWTRCCLQVNHDSFQRMLEEYRAAKAQQKDDQLKIKQ
jgi:hypothetical protein